jgi:hypothetical protein
MATAVPTSPAPCSLTRACWLRAWDRAKAERLIPYHNADGSWTVKTYTVRVTGPGWSDLACDCPAGAHGRICKHMSVVAKAVACGVWPVRPRLCAICGSQPVVRGKEACEGCAAVYPNGQEAASWEADPVHARQVNLTRSRLAIATPLDALFG